MHSIELKIINDANMFSGIIESTQKITDVTRLDKALRIKVSRPSFFNDLKRGDSIAINGICLTLEDFTSEVMEFTLGYETLRIIFGDSTSLESLDSFKKKLNLERSLRFGDRIHGHLVSGHVDCKAVIIDKQWQGESLLFKIQLPVAMEPFIWKKGTVAVNGVSLTVNELGESVSEGKFFEVCLIPETIKQTNLSDYDRNEFFNLEADYLIKGLYQASLKK